MPAITIGFGAAPKTLQASRGLYSVEGPQQSFAKTGALGYTIAVTPANPNIVSGTQQFTATATYSDSSQQNVTTTATWTSSNTSVATISNSSGTQGLATSVSNGYSTITATLGSVSGSTTLSVGSTSAVKFNPGWYLQSDNGDGNSGATGGNGRNLTDIQVLATTGTGGNWAGSKFLGYSPRYSWGNCETTAGTYNFQAITSDFNTLQSYCPGARVILQLQWGYSGTANASNPPWLPADILSSATYGAGPSGSGSFGWGLSGYNGTNWQLGAAAFWRPAVLNRWLNYLQQMANFSFVTTAGPYNGQTFTLNTHPLIEGVFDWMEDSWNFWYGPQEAADYSDSALQTSFQTEISTAPTYWTQTAYATFQSYGWSNKSFPNPDLPGLVDYCATHRNALSNSDTFGNGISAVSAHEIYCGNTWNGSAWVSGGANPDLRGTMAYMASVQGYDYNNESPGGNVAANILDIYATMQTLHATHGLWNTTDEIYSGGSISAFVSTYLVPFVNSHAIPNTTYPTNYPGNPLNLPLVTSSTPLLSYLGSFSIPNAFGYGSGAMSVSGSTLYVNAINQSYPPGTAGLGAVTIPTLSGVPVTNGGNGTATLKYSPTYITGEYGQTADGTYAQPTGSLLYNGSLYVTMGTYYDAGTQQTLPFICKCAQDLSSIGAPCNASTPRSTYARLFSGPMNTVPVQWQPVIGGPAYVTGGLGLSVVSNVCNGYGFSTFDPAQVTSGGASAVALTELLDYYYQGLNPPAPQSLQFRSLSGPFPLGGPKPVVTGSILSGQNVITGVSVPSWFEVTNQPNKNITFTDSAGVLPPGTYLASSTSSTITLSASATGNAAGDSFTITMMGDNLIASYESALGCGFISPGSRSLLYVSVHNYGPAANPHSGCDSGGSGSNDTPVPPDTNNYRRLQITAYDLNDVHSVKQGLQACYTPTPYAWWEFPNWQSIWTGGNCSIGSAPGGYGLGSFFFDYTSNKLYGTAQGFGSALVVHVWQVASP